MLNPSVVSKDLVVVQGQKMSLVVLLLCVCSLTLSVQANGGKDWCYHGCDNSPTHWSSMYDHCGGERQSPIAISSSLAQTDSRLDNFTLHNFTHTHALKTLTNNGHTVKGELEEGVVWVEGGGLSTAYSTLQFHLHWGDTMFHPGSEHTLDGHRYPMEMHIVSLKANLTEEEANADPEGIAVLAFLINEANGTSPQPWKDLTSYLMNLTTKDSTINVTKEISLDDLLGDVDLTRFYRYNGSLTTPTCDQAVVWTVFQQPITLSRELIDRFPKKTGMHSIYRPTQEMNGRHVYASPAVLPPAGHTWSYDDHSAFPQAKWDQLPHSYCGGQRQSPVDIHTSGAMVDHKLVQFSYTKFNDKHTMEYLVNTGHSVKCVLKEGSGVEVSGGGLGFVYSTLQFHFHWGDASDVSAGSEHTLDNKRFPMEMHIVNLRKDLTLEKAIETPTGLAVLGFLIEATDGDDRSTDGHTTDAHTTDAHTTDAHDQAWSNLTSYLSSIQHIASKVNVNMEISLDDLLGDVDRSEYYRYNGSLTTPSCNEAVVWTIFKQPIRVNKSLMKMFPTYAGYNNVFRRQQSMNGRKVSTTAAAPALPGPITVLLLLSCLCSLSVIG